MPATQWNATVVDCPNCEPFAVVGDLVVAVRTPRSQEFVTVEVAPRSRCADTISGHDGVLVSPRPTPRIVDQWHGEVHIGDPVSFRVEGASYRLTLDRLSEHAPGRPWVTCDFHLERD